MAREKGYMATTVADIVATAGVTREVFYEQFRGKHDAFLVAQGRGLEESVGVAAAEYFRASSWPDRVWSAGGAMLTYTAEHTDNAYVELVESPTTGAAAIQRSFENRMAYTLFLEDGYRQRPEAERLPRLCSEAIGGGLMELLRRQFILERAERVLELIPQGAYVTLAPFIGAAEAAEYVEGKVAEVVGA
jgi:AcrR family transcriptional regulator